MLGAENGNIDELMPITVTIISIGTSSQSRVAILRIYCCEDLSFQKPFLVITALRTTQAYPTDGEKHGILAGDQRSLKNTSNFTTWRVARWCLSKAAEKEYLSVM